MKCSSFSRRCRHCELNQSRQRMVVVRSPRVRHAPPTPRPGSLRYRKIPNSTVPEREAPEIMRSSKTSQKTLSPANSSTTEHFESDWVFPDAAEGIEIEKHETSEKVKRHMILPGIRGMKLQQTSCRPQIHSLGQKLSEEWKQTTICGARRSVPSLTMSSLAANHRQCILSAILLSEAQF